MLGSVGFRASLAFVRHIYKVCGWGVGWGVGGQGVRMPLVLCPLLRCTCPDCRPGLVRQADFARPSTPRDPTLRRQSSANEHRATATALSGMLSLADSVCDGGCSSSSSLTAATGRATSLTFFLTVWLFGVWSTAGHRRRPSSALCMRTVQARRAQHPQSGPLPPTKPCSPVSLALFAVFAS